MTSTATLTSVAWFKRMATLRNGTKFEPVLRIARSFSNPTGFRLTGCMLHASPPLDKRGLPRWRHLSLSLHCEGQEWFSLIELHGRPRSEWSKTLSPKLRSAGYLICDEWKDEVLLHRGLRASRDAVEELSFLETLGDTGEPARWRTRKARAPQTRTRVPKAAEILRILHAANETSITWDSAVVRMSRRWTMRTPAKLARTIVVDVDVYLWEKPSVWVAARVIDSRSRMRELPDRALERLTNLLRETGFAPRDHRLHAVGNVAVADLPAAQRLALKIGPRVFDVVRNECELASRS